MKLPVVLFGCCLLMLSGSLDAPAQQVRTPINNYTPPAYPDTNRIPRIKAITAKTDSLFRAYARTNNIPGLVYAIVADGQIVHSTAFGYSNVEKKIPANNQSVFRIASMTKSFAGMAILKLRDEGKLQLDDLVSKYIPETDSIIPLTGDSPPLTIRHLLTHTAGFPQDDPWADRQLSITDDAFTDFLKKGVSLSNPPGITYEYSNLGFTMLGTIINRVSGKHYESYIRDNIFTPLGMTDTYWEYSEVPDAQLAKGYRWVNNNWRKETLLHSGAYGMMGGLMTSIDDFVKYMQLHMNAWPARSGPDNPVMKRSSLREMHFPGSMVNLNSSFKTPDGQVCARATSYNFGLAWAKDCLGRIFIGHSGGLPGFGSNWVFLPEYGLGIVAFTNHTYKGPAILNIQVLNTVIAAAGLQPRLMVASPLLLQRQKQLFALLPDWNNAEQNNLFAENFFDDYFIDSLRKQTRGLFKKAGKIMGVKDIVPENQLRGSFTIQGEFIDISVRFTLSPENPGLIQHFEIRELPKKK
ncbi:MAG: beta-lactamase family protein [Chitinophagaceae bacterium]|nr:beta-lactamase family protein [Chitinophagaceae bacterium]MCW5927127.1 beta-lactamase family protein [Chitinophagaceae bacterium]